MVHHDGLHQRVRRVAAAAQKRRDVQLARPHLHERLGVPDVHRDRGTLREVPRERRATRVDALRGVGDGVARAVADAAVHRELEPSLARALGLARGRLRSCGGGGGGPREPPAARGGHDQPRLARSRRLGQAARAAGDRREIEKVKREPDGAKRKRTAVRVGDFFDVYAAIRHAPDGTVFAVGSRWTFSCLFHLFDVERPVRQELHDHVVDVARVLELGEGVQP